MKGLVPIIDIFAGPGGLSEGFSSFSHDGKSSVFGIRLSIEKDAHAYNTLLIRTFFRLAGDTGNRKALNDYYSMARGMIDSKTLFERYPDLERAVSDHVWQAELGSLSLPRETVRKRINNALGRERNFVLLGGPPCQAYSLAGRSRKKGVLDYDPNSDPRQTLYKEYLKILADHNPVVFIMENVKGLLSAKLNGKPIFDLIINDLANPGKAMSSNKSGFNDGRDHYRLFSFVSNTDGRAPNARDYVIKMEQYGVPQSRHRVIILGVRGDFPHVLPKTLDIREPVSVARVLGGMPRLRCGISKSDDSHHAWREVLNSALSGEWMKELKGNDPILAEEIKKTILMAGDDKLTRGGTFVKDENMHPEYSAQWYHDPNLGGVCNHDTRSHIPGDIHRYLFAAVYANLYGKTPTLDDFPQNLLPRHKNLRNHNSERAVAPVFSDRFRVQLLNKPATTITSHISKDGHYYIHPDPLQIRSLTVREAARLQTFPDNYFFSGPRTAQYHQIGNAVPPLLARQLASIVHDLLQQMRTNEQSL